VSVSKLCLGAMMFSGWGNRDHDESIRIIHTALDAGINSIDHLPATRALLAPAASQQSPAPTPPSPPGTT
jgi:hypothetical protein